MADETTSVENSTQAQKESPQVDPKLDVVFRRLFGDELE